MAGGLNLDAALFRFYFDEEQKRKSVITSAFIYSVGASIVVCLISFLLFSIFKGFMFKGPQQQDALFIALLSIPFMVAQNNALMLLRAQRRVLAFVCMSVANLLITLSLAIYLVKCSALGIKAVFVAMLISQAVVSSAGLLLLRKNFALSSVSAEIKNKMLLYSLPLIIPTMIGTFLGSINKYILQIYHGFSEVGVYAIGLKISMVMGLVALSVRQAWLPYAFSNMDKEDFKEKCSRAFKRFVGLLFLLAVLTVIFSRGLISLISTKDYLDAASIVGYICLGAIFINLSGSFFNLGHFIKKNTLFVFVAYITGFLINITLAVVLVPRISITGAAASLALGHFTTAMLLLYFSRRFYKIPYDLRFLFSLVTIYLLFFVGWNSYIKLGGAI